MSLFSQIHHSYLRISTSANQRRLSHQLHQRQKAASTICGTENAAKIKRIFIKNNGSETFLSVIPFFNTLYQQDASYSSNADGQKIAFYQFCATRENYCQTRRGLNDNASFCQNDLAVFFNLEAARESVKAALEFYNLERPHLSLDGMMPSEA